MPECIPCWTCNAPIVRKPGAGRKPRYCNPSCKPCKRPILGPPPPCIVCGAALERVQRGPARAYCSHGCFLIEHARRHAGSYEGRLKNASVAGERVSRQAVFERDKGICQLCRRRVNPKARDRMMRPSIDHIIPVSMDGSHTMANVQLAHRRCNLAKSNRTMPNGEQMRLIG